MIKILSLSLIMLISGTTPSWADECKLSSEKLMGFLNLDYQSFDQNLSGGWRKFANGGCEFEAAQVIDIYHTHHQKTLLPWQDSILSWHAGQLYAFQNIYPIAIHRFENSIDPLENPHAELRWNAYAKGSIAFLKGDLVELKRQTDLAKESKNEHNLRNVSILESMIRCMGRPYREAYNSSCK